MARHKYIKNINIDEGRRSSDSIFRAPYSLELDDDDEDRDYYGKSIEDEPLSSSAGLCAYKH